MALLEVATGGWTRAGRTSGQVLPLAPVRLSRGHDAGRPAIAERRDRDEVGALAGLPAVDLPASQGRQVPQRGRPDIRGREVQPAARHGEAVDHGLCGHPALHGPGHRDARPRPRRHRDQGAGAHRAELSLAVTLDRGHGPAEEVHRGQRRRRLREKTRRERPVPLRRAGYGLARQAGRGRQPLADRHAQVQERDVPAGTRGDHAYRAAPAGRGRHRRAEPRAREGARG